MSRGLRTRGSYNKWFLQLGLLQQGVFQPGVVTTRGLTTRGLTTRHQRMPKRLDFIAPSI